MTNPSEIERVVMRRVRRIRAWRMILHPIVLAGLVAVVALWGIGREVWVARVFENMPAEPLDAARFYLAAFLNTRTVVQLLSLAALASLVVLARSLARQLGGLLSPATA